jgi:hypothetical protein
MAAQGTNDFIAAFGLGALLGVGAVFLLRPSRDPRRRLVRKARPHGKRLQRRAREAQAAAERVLHAHPTADEAISSGKELIAEFRAEVARILDEARRELHGPPVGGEAAQSPAADAGGAGAEP